MNSTRERLTQAAVKRFYRDGFRSVGLDQVLADVGISKTAFYKHFDCKEDLVLAALEAQNQWLQETFRAMIRKRGGAHPAEQLRSLFTVIEQILNDDTFQGCIFVNVAIEFPLQHEPAHVAAAQHKRAIESMVQDLAAQAGAANPQQMAKELCLIMEGAYITRHVTGDKTTIEVAHRLADMVIAAHIPSAAKAESSASAFRDKMRTAESPKSRNAEAGRAL